MNQMKMEDKYDFIWHAKFEFGFGNEIMKSF